MKNVVLDFNNSVFLRRNQLIGSISKSKSRVNSALFVIKHTKILVCVKILIINGRLINADFENQERFIFLGLLILDFRTQKK